MARLKNASGDSNEDLKSLQSGKDYVPRVSKLRLEARDFEALSSENQSLGNSYKTQVYERSAIANSETQELIDRLSNSGTKVEVGSALSGVTKNFNDQEFRPNIYAIGEDFEEVR